MALKELSNLSQLEQVVFAKPRTPTNPGQTLHEPGLFPIQLELWNTILSRVDTCLATRIRDLLPSKPVTQRDHADHYVKYDCTGFAFYVLGDNFLDGITESVYEGSVIKSPEPMILWKDIPWWHTKDVLVKYGLRKVDSPNSLKPTLVVFTIEDPNFDYSQPSHFAIHLGNFNGQMWLAQKANAEYLPDLVPLSQIKNVYRGEAGKYNKNDPGIEFWELDD